MTERIDSRTAARAIALVGVFALRCAWGQFSPGPVSKAHASLAGPANCTACHAIGAGRRQFKCLSCHTEIGRRLAARSGLHTVLVKNSRDQTQCIRCHSEHNGENFVPVRWDVSLEEFDHSKTGYALEGAHARLECKRCHTPAHISAAERRVIRVKDLRRTYLGLTRACQSCHEDAHRGQPAGDCARCHNFSAWRPAPRFDHSSARFRLAGAHQRVACEKCHARAAGARPFVKFTGLAFAACTPCHQDPHRGAFTGPCESCHTIANWRPARLASTFDHSRTEFPLAGRHAGLACGKCHRTADFKQPVAHGRCLDCHTDQHRGQFRARADGGECAACHRVDGWKPAAFEVAEHRLMRYPLEGRHASVPCAKCHVPAGAATVYRGRFDQCSACHADAHRAQFAGPPYENRCEDCHTTKGFRPSTFTLARHAASRFSLTGAHAAIPCVECHRSPADAHDAARFRFGDLSCAACHQDPHQGQFRERMTASAGRSPAGCQACHTLRTWRDLSKFDHAAAAFPLAGTHRGVACGQCHRPDGGGTGIQAVSFRAAPRRCAGCHEDIHAGQFSSGGVTDCARCHNVLKWRPSLFDHDRNSSFMLAGAHRHVPCAQCHGTNRVINGKTVVLFKPTPAECSRCHAEAAN